MIKKVFFLSAFSMLLLTFEFSQLTYAQQSPFALIESHKQTVTKAEFASLRSAEPKPMTTSNGKGIVLSASPASLLVSTGPEDDNESYRAAGIRNPTLVLRAGTTAQILFVNTDGDAPHDIRIGDVKPPDTSGTVGTTRLQRARNNSFSADEITIRALNPGRYVYFCSIGSHAKNGMMGWIDVLPSDASMTQMMQAK